MIFDDIIKALHVFLNFKENWDGQGAKAIGCYPVMMAEELVRILRKESLELPFVQATNSGGVQLQWRGDHSEILMEIMPGGQMVCDLIRDPIRYSSYDKEDIQNTIKEWIKVL